MEIVLENFPPVLVFFFKLLLALVYAMPLSSESKTQGLKRRVIEMVLCSIHYRIHVIIIHMASYRIIIQMRGDTFTHPNPNLIPETWHLVYQLCEQTHIKTNPFLLTLPM